MPEWLVLVQHELLLFAGIFFLIGAIDELAADLAWFWLRLTGRASDRTLHGDTQATARLSGQAAIFIPAWGEAGIVGITVRHLLSVWPQPDLRLYVGCYANDPATLAAASLAAEGDSRVRIVVHDSDGPTTKADCLNRLYRALQVDEVRQAFTARMVVLHDAEDMVDPAALPLLDRAIGEAEVVQLPVLPMPQPRSRWIGNHYLEEFAEAHGKSMVVRDALGAGVPLAGVGCALSRDTLSRLAASRGDGPFASECLTEDYEMGVEVGAIGGRSRFLRLRTAEGRLIATRAYFPARIDHAVRQKTRWLHGIAFQSWDRLGWRAHPADFWMRLRDRRGPLTALVLAVAYLALVLVSLNWLLSLAFRGSGMSKPIHAGHAAEAGALAALAAHAGVTGAPDVLDGPVGFAAATSADRGQWDAALEGLGTRHAIAEITIKNHGCCGHAFAALDALRALQDEHGFAPSDVEAIAIGGYGPTKEICDRPHVETEQEARFSLQYCAAAMLVLGGVRIAAFAPDRLRDPAIRAIMPRVAISLDPDLADAYPKRRAARVAVTQRDGRALHRFQTTRKGDPDMPLTDAELSAKFRELATPSLGEQRANGLLQALWEGQTLPAGESR
ncbi:glycosyl transferase family protein [Leptolyngbya sp. 15MV]|nr:glycosyl transferase family protein [Leptolyngbya sp. 15MV]